MGKLIFLAMTPIDGCVSNLAGIKEWELKRNFYGITEMYDKADAFISNEMVPETVTIVRKTIDGYCIYEPAPGTENLTRQLFENRLVDEIYLYVFSYTLGSGIPLFPHNIGISNYWKLEEAKVYDEVMVRLHYIRVDRSEN